MRLFSKSIIVNLMMVGVCVSMDVSRVSNGSMASSDSTQESRASSFHRADGESPGLSSKTMPVVAACSLKQDGPCNNVHGSDCLRRRKVPTRFVSGLALKQKEKPLIARCASEKTCSERSQRPVHNLGQKGKHINYDLGSKIKTDQDKQRMWTKQSFVLKDLGDSACIHAQDFGEHRLNKQNGKWVNRSYSGVPYDKPVYLTGEALDKHEQSCALFQANRINLPEPQELERRTNLFNFVTRFFIPLVGFCYYCSGE